MSSKFINHRPIMILTSFFLNVNGLFDFDLTFLTEALLFFFLSLIITFFFISPISETLEKRAEFIEEEIKKSIIFLNFGSESLIKCVQLLVEEIDELNRQLKTLKTIINDKFEVEVISVQKENINLLNELKGDLTIKSAFLFSTLIKDANSLTDKFFAQKFQ